MSTKQDPTADDLRAALLAACAAAGHVAAIDAHDRLVFTADGGCVPVKIESAFRSNFSGKTTPASIVFARFSPYTRRFCPRSGLFDWPLVARTAREIANAERVEGDRRAETARRGAMAQANAGAINKALGLVSGAEIRAGAEHGRLVLMVGGRGSIDASEEQIRAMVAAARACGLVPGRAGAQAWAEPDGDDGADVGAP